MATNSRSNGTFDMLSDLLKKAFPLPEDQEAFLAGFREGENYPRRLDLIKAPERVIGELNGQISAPKCQA